MIFYYRLQGKMCDVSQVQCSDVESKMSLCIERLEWSSLNEVVLVVGMYLTRNERKESS